MKEGFDLKEEAPVSSPDGSGTAGDEFSEAGYEEMISRLFVRFPSFQRDGASAYKPGLAGMEFFDSLNGRPHEKYPCVHVAGTNGKGSVCSMLAAVLASSGLRVGLYTSPHILDFRERMRIVDGRGASAGMPPDMSLISEREVWDFVCRWRETFDHLDLSFFEITTSMAFDWFAGKKVDVAVIETGLGGRLDSTNVVTPVLSIITNIGLDHCDMLGGTLPEIAFEKAGIIKPGVPAVVGESDPETDPVFERKVLYSNSSDPTYMGNSQRIMGLLTFADKTVPSGWERHGDLLASMDLQGSYQIRNLRTVLAAVDVLRRKWTLEQDAVENAIVHAASWTGLHGRWELVSEDPRIICDIGHNAHGLKYNFARLADMLASGEADPLVIVYGSVADKDYESVFPLIPSGATLIFTSAEGRRACPAKILKEKFEAYQPGRSDTVLSAGTVPEAMRLALDVVSGMRDRRSGAADGAAPLIYVGGSTYVVSEAMAFLGAGA